MNKRGMTLAELLIAIALIGVGIMAAIGAFKGISQSVQSSKARSLATNIAQEKLQILMQKSYYEILVTSAPSFIVEPSSTIAYDAGYFPPETLTEGGIKFTRYTNIQVVQENSGAIQVLSPQTPDTGMRQISETVIWNGNGGDKFLTVQNVVNNPNTVMANAVLQGTVHDASGAAINNSLVDAAENIGWRDNTDATGTYIIHLSPGSLTFQASAQGYYSQVIPLSIAPNSTTTQNFVLTPISTGTIRGTAWIDNHLVISQVVASTGPANSLEYVELYNPSTATITMGSNLAYATANVWVVAFDAVGNIQSHPELFYMSTTVPSNRFYLISNTWDSIVTNTCLPFTVNGVTVNPDACWRTVVAPNHMLQCNPLSGGGGGCAAAAANAGGVGIETNGGTLWSGLGTATRIDALAWSGNGATPTAGEAAAATPPTPGTGLAAGEEFIRRADTGTTVNATSGNAYDSDNNSVDFLPSHTINFAPRTTANSYFPAAGSPAGGAVVSVTDGLSVPSSATITGNPPYAQFLIPGVATGTWTVFIDSTSASAEVDNISVLGNSTTSVNAVILTTAGVVGIVNGQVLDALGLPISGGILVVAGTNHTTTTTTGSYYMRLSTGTYDVIANPGNLNAAYATQTRTPVNVGLADVTANINFSLPRGGRINGWITRDGINPLQGVAVIALDSNGNARDNEITATDGSFLLINLSTGTYTVQPVLDPKEVSVPVTNTATVTAGFTTWAGSFTVTGALGTVAGKVKLGSALIQSGVLVLVSTAAISLPPPALSSASLTSSVFYANSSKEDGTYSVDVRSSTSTLYNAVAFYTYLNNQTPVISSRTITGISVLGGLTTSGQDFQW